MTVARNLNAQGIEQQYIFHESSIRSIHRAASIFMLNLSIPEQSSSHPAYRCVSSWPIRTRRVLGTILAYSYHVLDSLRQPLLLCCHVLSIVKISRVILISS